MNRLVALALPVLGLAALWGWTHTRAQQGTEWDVPVQGYDPRDLLRGHYITYRYDWPNSESRDLFGKACIEGTPPVVERIRAHDGSAACAHPLRTEGNRHGPWFGFEGGQLYVPQTQTAGLEEKLRDPKLQGVVRIRVRDDGHITPLSISFRPRIADMPTR